MSSDNCNHSPARGFFKNEYTKSEIIYCRKCKETIEVLSTTKLKEMPKYVEPIKETKITNQNLF